MVKIILLNVLIIASALHGAAFAEESAASRNVILDRTISIEFEPVEFIYFVRMGNAAATVITGFGIPLTKTDSEQSTLRFWRVGVEIAAPADAKRISSSLLVRSKEGRLEYFPPLLTSIESKDLFNGSCDQLRSHLLQRQDVLKSFEMQVQAQEESLERLRSDAEVIANVSKIVEIRDEVERLKLESSNLDKDLENIHSFIRLARAKPIPPNMAGLEVQLTRQVAELAQAAKTAESQEMKKKSSIETDLQRKLQLIESTRYEDPDQLEQELAALRRKKR